MRKLPSAVLSLLRPDRTTAASAACATRGFLCFALTGLRGRALLAALLLTLPWAPFAAAQQQLQTMTSGGFVYELNTDRLGGDYFDYELKTQSPESCHELCEADKNCKAFTYTRPNFQGDHPRCWLKAVVPPTSKNFCCTSGVMNR